MSQRCLTSYFGKLYESLCKFSDTEVEYSHLWPIKLSLTSSSLNHLRVKLLQLGSRTYLTVNTHNSMCINGQKAAYQGIYEKLL